MKKQILILTFFFAAVMVSINANGQLLVSDNGTEPATISCSGDDYPLHPLAGVPYTYRLSNPTLDAEQWTWFASKNPTFITGGAITTTDRLDVTAGELLGTDYGYNTVTTTAAGGDSVSITWSPEILAATEYQADASGWATADAATPSPTFVVGYAESNCTDNIQVYEINPVVLFTVDVANIAGDGTTMGYGVDTSQCVSPVQSAIYNGGSVDNEMLVDYGTDTLMFEVVAANFVTNWDAYITATGGWDATNGQTATMSLFPSKADMDAGTNQIGADYTLTSGTAVQVDDLTAAASVSSTVDGVSLWIQIVIDNNNYESLTAQTLVLAVDGQDASGQWDMDESDCTDPTSATQDQADVANHTIDPRPTIEHNTDDEGTINPNAVVPKEGDASYTRY